MAEAISWLFQVRSDNDLQLESPSLFRVQPVQLILINPGVSVLG